MALILFFLAAGSGNNLIFLVVFFLISISLTALYSTNRNVEIVDILSVQSSPGFAEETVGLSVRLQNKSSRLQSSALEFCIKNKNQKTEITKKLELLPKEIKNFDFSFNFRRRGWNKVPQITLESSFPFGILRAWKYFDEERPVLVFPARKGRKEFPQQARGHEQQNTSGVFRDHRTFQSADSLSRIDWRASARRQQLLIKNFEVPENPALNFSWEQSDPSLSFEQRISQLALWIDLAEKGQEKYSLQIGPKIFEINRGASHWYKCLEYLALLEEKDFLL